MTVSNEKFMETDPAIAEVLKTPEIPVTDMMDTGLLWYINRTCLHPLGFALAINPSSGNWQLWGNGDEPWTYAEDVPENDKFDAFKKLLKSVTATDS